MVNSISVSDVKQISKFDKNGRAKFEAPNGLIVYTSSKESFLEQYKIITSFNGWDREEGV
jgi:hypothetical protein